MAKSLVLDINTVWHVPHSAGHTIGESEQIFWQFLKTSDGKNKHQVYIRLSILLKLYILNIKIKHIYSTDNSFQLVEISIDRELV